MATQKDLQNNTKSILKQFNELQENNSRTSSLAVSDQDSRRSSLATTTSGPPSGIWQTDYAILRRFYQ